MDQNYIEASELFLVFSAQMKAVITQTEIFQTRMSEALSASTEQADAFVRMSQGGRKRDGGQDGDWLLAARARTSLFYSVVKEGTGVVKQIMDENLNGRLLVALRREVSLQLLLNCCNCFCEYDCFNSDENSLCIHAVGFIQRNTKAHA